MNTQEITITIGGITQSLFNIRTDISNPVLLILHGGPGSPDRPLVYKYNRELSKYFTVICWDQRMSGKSYHQHFKNETFTINTLLCDLKELVMYLCKRYKKDKIYLAGHSWGAHLGLLFASKYPQFVKYYIGTGQGISSSADEIDKYNFVKRKAKSYHDKNILRKLEKFGTPDGTMYSRNSKSAKKFVNRLVRKYGGYIYPDSELSTKSYLYLYLKHYGTDIIKVLKGMYFSVKYLTNEIQSDNSLLDIKSLNVPILLIFGEQDYVCPVDTAKRWFDNLNAPKKDFVIIKNASHMVNFEKPTEWNTAVKSVLNNKL